MDLIVKTLMNAKAISSVIHLLIAIMNLESIDVHAGKDTKEMERFVPTLMNAETIR